jgi:glycosyltransferase involved in cell wall biosynthesis
MRILHTIDSLGIYGAEAVLLSLAQEQLRQGHEPVILSIGNLNSASKAIEVEAGKRGIACIAHRMKDGFNLSGARRLMSVAREQRIDVIHSHGYKTNILLACLPRRARHVPVVTTLHGWTAKKSLSKLGLYRFLDQKLLRRHDGVVLVNDQLRKISAVAALEPQKVHTVANGIASESQTGEPANHGATFDEIMNLKRPERVLIGAVGRLSPEKNFSALIEALAQVPASDGVVLAILGDGPEAPRLRQLIEANNLGGRVVLGGYVADARRFLALFDLLVIPSLTEGLPMILLEAMATNLPIIAAQVGDIPAALKDLGILVPPGDVGALRDAIVKMSRQLPHYRRVAGAGAQRVSEHYSAASMAARYENIYRSLLNSQRPGMQHS